jgi:DNA repair protein RecO (recombination protein O)
MSHHIYTTIGFLIHSTNTGEANKLLYIFTKDLGMIMTHAQGIRKNTSKLQPYAQNYSLSNFSIVKGKDVWRIVSASECSEDFISKIRKNNFAFQIYVRILDIVKRLLSGEEKNEELFHVIYSGVEFLSLISNYKDNSDQLESFERIIILRILYNLGYVRSKELFKEYLLNKWDFETLNMSKETGKEVIKAINNGLKESHM